MSNVWRSLITFQVGDHLSISRLSKQRYRCSQFNFTDLPNHCDAAWTVTASLTSSLMEPDLLSLLRFLTFPQHASWLLQQHLTDFDSIYSFQSFEVQSFCVSSFRLDFFYHEALPPSPHYPHPHLPYKMPDTCSLLGLSPFSSLTFFDSNSFSFSKSCVTHQLLSNHYIFLPFPAN